MAKGLLSFLMPKKEKRPQTPSPKDTEQKRRQVMAQELAGSADQSGTQLGGGSGPSLGGGTKDLLGG